MQVNKELATQYFKKNSDCKVCKYVQCTMYNTDKCNCEHITTILPKLWEKIERLKDENNRNR